MVPSMRTSLVALAFVAAVGFSGCVSTHSSATAPTRDPAASRDWVARRAAQLAASGLSGSEAEMKARSEFAARFGYEPEAVTLYDSKAKQRAEQQKVNEGFEKLQRGSGN